MGGYLTRLKKYLSVKFLAVFCISVTVTPYTKSKAEIQLKNYFDIRISGCMTDNIHFYEVTVVCIRFYPEGII